MLAQVTSPERMDRIPSRLKIEFCQGDPSASSATPKTDTNQAKKLKLDPSCLRPMISVVLILNGRGRVLISRNFRTDVDARAISSAFRSRVVNQRSGQISPVVIIGQVSFLFVKYDSLYVVACTKQNVNATLVFQFLYKLVDLFKAYFSGVFSETIVKENFALIYELIDEVLDYGYPQNCEPDILKMYITSRQLPPRSAQEMRQISRNVTGAVSWRKQGIQYRKNEVFLDVVESVNMLMSAKGTPLNQEVIGKVMMKAFLSGMPECKLGLNDKLMMQGQDTSRRNYKAIDIDDIKFHQCVKLGKFDSDRTICFVPLDGEFEIMSYRITDGIIPPFRLPSPVVRELGRTKVEVNVTVRSVFADRYFGKNVIVKIPMPTNVASARIRTTYGRARYRAEEHAIVWTLKRFPGQFRANITADVALLAKTVVNAKWAKPPISLTFQVPMFPASQIHVRFLRVIESKLNYRAVKWVRYITKAGSYEIRI